jgi:hypothetical protein
VETQQVDKAEVLPVSGRVTPETRRLDTAGLLGDFCKRISPISREQQGG